MEPKCPKCDGTTFEVKQFLFPTIPGEYKGQMGRGQIFFSVFYCNNCGHIVGCHGWKPEPVRVSEDD